MNATTFKCPNCNEDLPQCARRAGIVWPSVVSTLALPERSESDVIYNMVCTPGRSGARSDS